MGGALRKRQATLSEEVKAIAWKAQHRLHPRYRRLLGRGKCQQQVVTAVARELLGFDRGHRGNRAANAVVEGSVGDQGEGTQPR